MFMAWVLGLRAHDLRLMLAEGGSGLMAHAGSESVTPAFGAQALSDLGPRSASRTPLVARHLSATAWMSSQIFFSVGKRFESAGRNAALSMTSGAPTTTSGAPR